MFLALVDWLSVRVICTTCAKLERHEIARECNGSRGGGGSEMNRRRRWNWRCWRGI